MATQWIPVAKLEPLIQADLLFLLLALGLSSWLFYKLFLRALSPERHRNLQGLFRNLLLHSVNLLILCVAYWTIHTWGEPLATKRVIPYLALLAVLCGCTVFVKSVRIIAFEYLFLTSMRAGVPLLIVNLLTLVMSLTLGLWVLSGIFGFQLMPLVATSAIFSIVLGLALQDTLGNLIAGVALQLDKPYEIGDWIEVSNGHAKWVGQVEEITWRATVLVATTEEAITLPNRLMAQAEISNFSAKQRPFVRSHIFRIPFTADRAKAKEALLSAVTHHPVIKRTPAPLVLITDATDSWLSLKLVYYIDDYGRQFITADEVIEAAMTALEKAHISVAPQRLLLEQKA